MSLNQVTPSPDAFFPSNAAVISTDHAPAPDSIPVGGRLQLFWREWQGIGAPKRVVNWLKLGYQLPFKRNPEGRRILPPLMSRAPKSLITTYADLVKQRALDQMILDLIQKNAIEKVPPGTSGFYSRVFLVPKKSGKLRLVIDLSKLNAFLEKFPFKMDTASVIRESIEPGMWSASLDLSDAYLHIPMHPGARNFLLFQIGDQVYRFLVLPFGLSTAPFVFSEVMKFLKKWGRAAGLLLFQYLDDWLLLNLDRSTLDHQMKMLVRACLRLGLLVNFQKSELEPTQNIQFLGDQYNFELGLIHPTQDRFEKICRKIARMTTSSTTTVKRVHSLMGLLVSTERTVPLGRVHYREFQRVVIRVLTQNWPDERRVELNHAQLSSLLWWISPSNVLQGVSMRVLHPTLEIQTDASTSGWGFFFQGKVWQGVWPPEDATRHINHLEMLAVSHACEILSPQFAGHAVSFLIDNATTVAYLKNQGGTRSPDLCDLTRKILLNAQKLRFSIHPKHIAGQLNAIADLASRQGQVINTEWNLDPVTFIWIQHQSPWGPAVLDLFANQLSHRLPRYASPCPDPAAELINSMIVPWPEVVLYAFPPTTLLARVLQKIRLERPRHLLLVAPRLLEAPWFPVLDHLPRLGVTQLPLSSLRLTQPHWDHSHPKPMLFNLYLWCIHFPT